MEARHTTDFVGCVLRGRRLDLRHDVTPRRQLHTIPCMVRGFRGRSNLEQTSSEEKVWGLGKAGLLPVPAFPG